MKETQRGDVVETSNGARLSSVVHHYNETSWFDMIPGERISFRVRSTQVNGRYSIIDSLAGPGKRAAADIAMSKMKYSISLVARSPSRWTTRSSMSSLAAWSL